MPAAQPHRSIICLRSGRGGTWPSNWMTVPLVDQREALRVERAERPFGMGRLVPAGGAAPSGPSRRTGSAAPRRCHDRAPRPRTCRAGRHAGCTHAVFATPCRSTDPFSLTTSPFGCTRLIRSGRPGRPVRRSRYRGGHGCRCRDSGCSAACRPASRPTTRRAIGDPALVSNRWSTISGHMATLPSSSSAKTGSSRLLQSTVRRRPFRSRLVGAGRIRAVVAPSRSGRVRGSGATSHSDAGAQQVMHVHDAQRRPLRRPPRTGW